MTTNDSSKYFNKTTTEYFNKNKINSFKLKIHIKKFYSLNFKPK